MKDNKIQFQLELSVNQKHILVLTPENYKEEFKTFIKVNNINPTDAYYIKNMIQAKLLSIFKGNKELQRKKSVNQLSHTINQTWYSPKQSPKFANIKEQKETQTLHIQPRQQPQMKFFKKKEKQQIQSLFSTNLVSTAIPVQTNKQNEQKVDFNNQSMFKQDKQQDYLLHHKHYRQLSSPCITQTKKKNNYQQKTPSTKNKTNHKDFLLESFDRLYHASTQSFSNKKNEQVNRKQLEDYRQVQKYSMNQNLKRTTQDFFNHLHNSPTKSYTAKHTKNTIVESLIQQEQPTKKVILSQSFKGSTWNSGSRCEKKIFEQKQRKYQDELKKRQEQIIKRIKQQKSKPKYKKMNQIQHKSRSCQRCNPKTPQRPKKKQKTNKNMPQPIKTVPRPYISNLLMESYKQFTKQVSQL